MAAGAGFTDPASGNNSATDIDTLPKIFLDGFETGDTSLWSFRQPAGLSVALVLPVQSQASLGFSYDFGLLQAIPNLAPSIIAGTLDAQGRTVFTVEARRNGPSAALELRLVAADGKGSWQEVAQRLQESGSSGGPPPTGATTGPSPRPRRASALWLDGLTGFTGRPATLLILQPGAEAGG